MGGGGSKMTLEEQVRENKRSINRAIRELDRERNQLENQEKKLVNDIKAAAKKSQMSSVKIMAKDLVRTRKYQQKFLQSKSQLQGIGLRLQILKSQEALQRSMKEVTSAMKGINARMDPQAMTQIMQEFAAASDQMNLQQDLMEQAIDDSMEEGDDAEEEERIVGQVLEEIGVDVTGLMEGAPTEALDRPQSQAVAPAASADDDLEARLNALKK
eukprot:gnl/MRDRNA2_/MRDRNA2_94828_c0_seq1.p1 gnl/MRDRNA2_/MRDRNA2_94828_c0~~gnl/MRDRNA2_/MRDRNA2_94828_c0_seq1.p1  ORF type:complete len:214 (-),score=63.96 gnl/MRDRNA2_/MRDRNA2_94828_c0_seq1:481-1122(-)